ncbi:hypothetical protein HMPREF1544_01667 [Mucor circinelloides 1006PhL]|uniref:Uncharacterized protein n=1 Tax=Mucor circinelloides f. circinelloides (strain 1006PhL) TaxID=1220926 RepID=S2JMG9_MUCC1|nr:hypothetical protein HMPREF1544_01667 [Mucor circinelloides 1006PhL]
MSTFDNHSQQDETIIDFENDNAFPQNDNIDNDNDDDDDDDESDYSLDYEFPGPRYANYRNDTSSDDASELSDLESDTSAPRFDMWDDDPYNDFTWESNDMQLTRFIKKKQRQLKRENRDKSSFWNKEKGWPKQLPYSCSSSNHDQSANAICLVESNYGLSEFLYAVYRDRIVECGKPPSSCSKSTKANNATYHRNHTTLIESSNQQLSNTASHASDKFMDTHQSVSLSKSNQQQQQVDMQQHEVSADQTSHPFSSESLISKFKPYTKYLKRSDYPGSLPQDAYLYLGFDPQCLAQKYGYMAIGGVEGEFELYCCMNPESPVKIWGTKFKGRDNVMLMTNAIQIIRFKNTVTGSYQHMLIGCMNEAGLLFYQLPAHSQCRDIRTLRQHASPMVVQLHSHLRSFNGVPINDAKLSPDESKLVCVGDDNMIFMIDVYHCATTGEITFGAPFEIVIPSNLLSTTPYSSQYVAWSPSSQYFAHTSDSHNLVLVWRVSTREILYAIDAAGYTYAISFHPQLDNILVFTNRYGYFHTVDFTKGTTAAASTNDLVNVLSFDHQTHASRGHQCVDSCDAHANHAVFHTQHLRVQHEITMVSFRGEINTRLRILAKINGIEWSKDGKYLYVATKKRVLAFQFRSAQQSMPALIDITGAQIRKSLENEQRLKLDRIATLDPEDTKRLQDWNLIPTHIRNRILGDTQLLACHW